MDLDNFGFAFSKEQLEKIIYEDCANMSLEDLKARFNHLDELNLGVLEGMW